MTQVNTELLEALKAFVNQAHFIWREDDEGMIAARAAIARAEAKQAEPQKREFPEDTFAFDPNDFLYQKGLHDGKLIEQAERVEPVMDIDLAKMVVRSAGYSLVSQRFIVNFAEFIQDWRKGDFELSPLAACDVEACFEAWQEEVNQKEVSTPPAAERVEPVRGNIGHGHVWSRPDGLKVRCGGPTICVVCAKDAASVATPPASAVSEPLTDSYVQNVPDKCDRITWRNKYYHLPIEKPTAASSEAKRVELAKPVAWYIKEHGDIVDLEWDTNKPNTTWGDWKPLYATPPAAAVSEPQSPTLPMIDSLYRDLDVVESSHGRSGPSIRLRGKLKELNDTLNAAGVYK